MKFISILIAAIAAMFQTHAADATSESIAQYTNSDLHRSKEGRLIGEILSDKKIEWTALGSLGTSVSVDSKDAAYARYLLAKLALRENLDISLMDFSKGRDRYNLTDAKEVVSNYEKRKAEQDAAASP